MKTLRFSPPVWAKLQYLRDLGDTEIGGFGVTHPDDPLYVIDFYLTKQECTYASVDFDDEGISDFLLDMVEAGYEPKDFGRVWVHTHPSGVNSPSSTDEKTFENVFGKPEYAIMFILTKDETVYCRLRVNTLLGSIEQLIDTRVDFTTYKWGAPNFDSWKAEYEKYVSKKTYSVQNYQGHWRGNSYVGGRNWHGGSSDKLWNGYEEDDDNVEGYHQWLEKFEKQKKERKETTTEKGEVETVVELEDTTPQDPYLNPEVCEANKVSLEQAEEKTQEAIELAAEDIGIPLPGEQDFVGDTDSFPLHKDLNLCTYLDEELVQRLDQLTPDQRELFVYEVEDYYDMYLKED
jgi:hypothetical protein